jgi:serine/threonine protein kinase
VIVTLSEAAACAPEVATGGVDLSSCDAGDRWRAEAYALGASLYFALSGRLPYEAETPERYCRLQLEEAPLPLIEVAPHLERHGSVLRLVDRCLERSAAQRPKSLDQMGREIAIAVREAQRLESSGGFLPLRVSDSKGMELPIMRPPTGPVGLPGADARRQIWVLIALVGLLLFLVYYQSHSGALGVDDTPLIVVP